MCGRSSGAVPRGGISFLRERKMKRNLATISLMIAVLGLLHACDDSSIRWETQPSNTCAVVLAQETNCQLIIAKATDNILSSRTANSLCLWVKEHNVTKKEVCAVAKACVVYARKTMSKDYDASCRELIRSITNP